jgi:hypothetical protein
MEMLSRYKISRYLGTNGDGIPEYNYEEFYAHSDEDANKRFQQEKEHHKDFSGFLTKETSSVIARIKSEKYA